MSFFKVLLASIILIVTPTLATPLFHRDGDLVSFPPFVHRGILCDLPIPIVQKILCPRQGTPSLTVNTPIGTAHGAADGSNAIRFAAKYANAQRWQDSSVVSTWTLPCVFPNLIRIFRLHFRSATEIRIRPLFLWPVCKMASTTPL